MKLAGLLMRRKFLLFLLLSLLLYGNTLKNGYAIDDQFVTETNISTKGLRSVKTIFSTFYADDGKNNYEYRPIVKVSFALEHQLFGVKPWISHLINLLIYALCLFLLHRMLLTVLHAQPPELSLYITIVFAFLPIHTEVVASLKNRDVLLCFVFCMSAMLHTDAFFRSGRYGHLAAVLLFCLLGFLTKYDLLPYLVVAPLVYYKKYKARTKLILLLSPALIFAVAFFASKEIRHLFLAKGTGERIFSYSENPLFFDHSFHLRLSTAFNAMGHYLKMLVLPTNMVCYYGYDTLPVSNMSSVFAITGIILTSLMLYGFFKWFKGENPFWYAIVFFAIPISMYLNMFKVVPGIVADRFLFFASLGFSIALVHALFLVAGKHQAAGHLKPLKPAGIAIIALILVINSGFVWLRNAEWKNRITLYGHDIKKRPESVPLQLLYSLEILSNMNRPNYFLTEANKLGYVNKATASLQRALATDPRNVTALHNLGFIRQNVYRDYAGAIPYYEKALLLDSGKFESRFNLAYCYFNSGQGEKAEELVMQLYPQHSDQQAVLDLINYVLIANKKSHEGIVLFDELEKKHPENQTIPIIQGNFYLALSDTLNAKKAYEKALKKDPNNDQLRQIVAKLSK